VDSRYYGADKGDDPCKLFITTLVLFKQNMPHTPGSHSQYQ
jgi:hypothetical protein